MKSVTWCVRMWPSASRRVNETASPRRRCCAANSRAVRRSPSAFRTSTRWTGGCGIANSPTAISASATKTIKAAGTSTSIAAPSAVQKPPTSPSGTPVSSAFAITPPSRRRRFSSATALRCGRTWRIGARKPHCRGMSSSIRWIPRLSVLPARAIPCCWTIPSAAVRKSPPARW